MVRNGKPRVLSNNIGINTITNFAYQGKNYLQIKGVATTKYRVSDVAGIAATAKQLGITPAEAKAKYPIFQDGKDDVLINEFTYSYTVAKDSNGWGIVGYNTDYKASYDPSPAPTN